ncbi:MAG: hypothetical protein LBT47_07045 [Deltaproteobacteria bacterium]|jgi:hypothetical protein|nr:hypothetical protein [Deltaproteobacteria bacterium]
MMAKTSQNFAQQSALTGVWVNSLVFFLAAREEGSGWSAPPGLAPRLAADLLVLLAQYCCSTIKAAFRTAEGIKNYRLPSGSLAVGPILRPPNSS